MINRGFSIHKKLVELLIAGGLVMGSHAAFAQDPAKEAAPAVAPAVAVEAAAATPAAPEAAAFSAADIKLGQNIFEGIVRLKNGGASCNTCHHVQNDSVIGGGVLAAELTTAFSRMGAEGVTAMLPRDGAESPFPVMQAAYQGKEITEAEARALVAFLQNADKQSALQKPSQYSLKMFLAGCAGVIVMLIFFGIVGKGRKRKSVNSEVFERQMKTQGVD